MSSESADIDASSSLFISELVIVWLTEPSGRFSTSTLAINGDSSGVVIGVAGASLLLTANDCAILSVNDNSSAGVSSISAKVDSLCTSLRSGVPLRLSG